MIILKKSSSEELYIPKDYSELVTYKNEEETEDE